MSVSRPAFQRHPAEATRLIAEATSGLEQKELAEAWARGSRSFVSLQLSGHRKLRQSLLDALYRITKNPQLVADVKAAAIAAWLDRRPGVDPERAFLDDVEVAS